MRRTGPETRRRIVESAYELFYRKGFSRSSVDAIAAKAGVTKRTLYAHFASKDDLLAAALKHLDSLAQARINRWGARLSGDVDTMLDTLFADLARWAATPRWAGAGFTRLVMELADLPGHPARAIARRHKKAVMGFLAKELAERQLSSSEKHAQDVMLLLEGAMSLMLVHGDRRIALAAAEAAKRLVRA